MFKKLVLIVSLALVLQTAGRAHAQPPQVEHSAPFWQVSFWNNMTLAGEPVAYDQHAHIDFNWESGSPHSAVQPDRFSARWTRYIEVATGRYRFTATSDDGIRVYVDGRTIIDEWHDHPSRTYVADVNLSAGHHLVMVEYYENKGHAVAMLSWEALPDTPHNWHGEYFSNRHLSGSPAMVLDDARIDFNWGYGAPAPGIPSDGFSIRWTRTVPFGAGTYRFTTSTDDGVRLWVNGHLLIDRWHDQPLRAHSGTIYLSGKVPVMMEYYENRGVAAARLAWEYVDGDEPPTGTVLVDDGGPGFAKGGAARAWRSASEGYARHSLWTWNNDQVRPHYNWARWAPDLTPGRYEIFIYVPERNATTSQARYWISHLGGYTLRVLDQSANRGRWVSLGAYQFRGTSSDYVSLADVTFESYLSRSIAFDAVKWVSR